MTRSFVALVAGAIAIGFAPIFVRLSETGPSATAFWRILFALPFLFAWMRMGSARELSKANLKLLVAAGVLFAGDLAAWHWAIHFTQVANATLEANLSAIFVPILAWGIFGHRPTYRFLVALFLAFGGAILIIGRNAHPSAHTFVGDTLGVITALFYSGYLLTVKTARDEGVGTAQVMAISGAITAVMLLALAILSDETIMPLTMRGWLVLLSLGIFSHFGGQSLVAYALGNLPASVAGLVLLLQPATAGVVAYLLLGESFSTFQFLGGSILLLGVSLAGRNSKK